MIMLKIITTTSRNVIILNLFVLLYFLREQSPCLLLNNTFLAYIDDVHRIQSVPPYL